MPVTEFNHRTAVFQKECFEESSHERYLNVITESGGSGEIEKFKRMMKHLANCHSAPPNDDLRRL